MDEETREILKAVSLRNPGALDVCFKLMEYLIVIGILQRCIPVSCSRQRQKNCQRYAGQSSISNLDNDPLQLQPGTHHALAAAPGVEREKEEEMLIYETRLKENGDCEVWRHVEGSKKPEELIATFHNFLRDINVGVNIAEINAGNFAKEQNNCERVLEEGLKVLQRLKGKE